MDWMELVRSGLEWTGLAPRVRLPHTGDLGIQVAQERVTEAVSLLPRQRVAGGRCGRLWPSDFMIGG